MSTDVDMGLSSDVRVRYCVVGQQFCEVDKLQALNFSQQFCRGRWGRKGVGRGVIVNRWAIDRNVGLLVSGVLGLLVLRTVTLCLVDVVRVVDVVVVGRNIVRVH